MAGAFLSGYLAQRQADNQNALSGLQQTTGVLSLQNTMRQQAEQDAVRGVLAESPSLESAFPRLMQIGPTGVSAAMQLAQVQQALKKETMGQPIGAGGLRLPDGTIVAPAARPETEKPTAIGAGGLRLPSGEIVPPVVKPVTEKWSEPYQLGGAMVQKNEATGQIRTAVTREPQIRVTNPTPPIRERDDQGNVRLYDRQGNLIRNLGRVGAPSPANQKLAQAKRQTVTELNRLIQELEPASNAGGLIDKSTGSGIGTAVDFTAGLVGKATPGAVAAARLKPIADMALKMVPRFEGPQSDKDTKSYRDAAGDLANTMLPVKVRQAAAKEIIRLAKERKQQFILQDFVSAEMDATSAGDSEWEDI